ncbi:MAG: class I adenylate-forming enzyme family protein [Candidatus Nanoarchaeia archaeon]
MSLVHAFLATCRAYPKRTALTFEDTSLTFEQLNSKANAVASLLQNKGVKQGDRVAICMPNSIELILAYLGALKLGAVLVPISPSFTTRDIKNIIEDTQASCLIAVNTVEKSIMFSHEDLPEANDLPIIISNEDPAIIFYTSGTTGSSKGALLKHKHILASLRTLQHTWALSPKDHLLLTLPLHHIHGLGVGICGAWLIGYQVTLTKKFNAEETLTMLKDCTLFMGVPTMYVKMLETEGNFNLDNMRLFISGSAPLKPETFTAFQKRFNYTILERAGMSETMMNFSNPLGGERKVGSVGKPLLGVEVKITDDEFNDTTGPGKLLLRGPNVFEEYWNNPKITKDSFHKSWFITGDIAELDNQGYVYFRGRTKDMIISGGLNIYPMDIESVLDQHPKVVESAVVGVPDKYLGEAVKAFVISKESISEDELIKFAASHLASFKKPRSITFIDALPRNQMGKVQKHRLK